MLLLFLTGRRVIPLVADPQGFAFQDSSYFLSKFRVIACLQVGNIRPQKARHRCVGNNFAVRKSEEYIPLAHYACRSVVILYYLGKYLLSAFPNANSRAPAL